MLRREPPQVRRWVRRFERLGPRGLAEPPASGRATALSPGQRREISEQLGRSPCAAGHPADAWTGALLQRHLLACYQEEQAGTWSTTRRRPCAQFIWARVDTAPGLGAIAQGRGRGHARAADGHRR